MNSMVPWDVVGQVCEDRDKCIAAFAEFFDMLEAAAVARDRAMRYLNQACGMTNPLWAAAEGSLARRFIALTEMANTDGLATVTERMVDNLVWKYLMESSGYKNLMDVQSRKDFEKQMAFVPPEAHQKRNGSIITQEEAMMAGPPPVTEDNVRATFDNLIERAPEVAHRGIANVFSKLDPRFRTHRGFEVGSVTKSGKTAGRVIMDFAFDDSGMIRSSTTHQLVDVERVFRMLDGQDITTWDTVADVVKRERERWTRYASEHDTAYFVVKVYKNGNCHLWFKRGDLVRKVNDILADYYGERLGWGRYEATEEDVFRNADKRSLARNLGEYFTPPEVVGFVNQRTMFWKMEGKRGLEPSAGSGNLARLLTDAKCVVDCIEIQSSYAAALQKTGKFAMVYSCDFLQHAPKAVYSAIVMNPPFNLEGGVDHVNHAFAFLDTSGGFELAAIMGAYARYADTSKARAFRAKVRRIATQTNATVKWYDLPERSFAASGTNVNTCLMVMRKVR